MGRLLSDGNINYSWSDNDRLISIKKVGVTTNYLYNADGLRTGKLSDSDTSYYLVDPTLPYGQVLAEYGSDTTFYVVGLQREVAISDNDTSYFVFDGQNSVRHLVDGNEQFTDSYSYDSYGNITESDGVTKNSFLYRGEQFDLESGNYYLRARYYSPISASFISVDPFVGDVGNPITLNKYLYGNGNPVMFSDPSGNVGISGAMATIAIAGILATLPTPVYAKVVPPRVLAFKLMFLSNIERYFLDHQDYRKVKIIVEKRVRALFQLTVSTKMKDFVIYQKMTGSNKVKGLDKIGNWVSITKNFNNDYDIPPGGSKSDPYWWNGNKWNINPGSLHRVQKNYCAWSDSPGPLDAYVSQPFSYRRNFKTIIALKSNPTKPLRSISWGVNITNKSSYFSY